MTPAPPPRRILVKQVNWLGDVVMSLPALRAVRRAYPDAHLSILIKHDLAGFFAGSRWIDEIIRYRLRRGLNGLRDRAAIVTDLRRRDFDIAILFPDSFEAALWAWAARVPVRVGYKRDGRSLLLTRGVERTPAAIEGHQVHYRLRMLRTALGIDGDPTPVAPDVDDDARGNMLAWLDARRRRQGKLVALAPAAAYGPAKEWPAAHWIRLIRLLAERHDAECVLLGAASERQKCEAIARGCGGVPPLIAAGETSMAQLVALLSLCDGFVGNDSGAMHVAGALGIPTIGIFGSTDPARTSPLGPRVRVVYRRIECSPCLQRTCRFGHYNCLTQISADEVAAQLGSGLVN
jgi:heptosyltransferase-2